MPEKCKDIVPINPSRKLAQGNQVSVDAATARCPLTGQATVEAFDGHRWQMPPDGRFFGYRESPSVRLFFCDPIPDPEELRLFYEMHYDYAWFHQHRHFKRIVPGTGFADSSHFCSSPNAAWNRSGSWTPVAATVGSSTKRAVAVGNLGVLTT